MGISHQLRWRVTFDGWVYKPLELVVLHLNRLNQHVLHLTNHCQYDCLGCHLDGGSTNMVNHIIQRSKKGDIVNLVGGDPTQHDAFEKTCDYLKKNQRTIRCWTNHLGIPSVCNKYQASFKLDEWVVYCPSPNKKQFNDCCGYAYFDAFCEAIHTIKDPLTLSFMVTPLTVQWLPDFFDLMVSANAKGFIFVSSKGLTVSEREYIYRYKYVRNTLVITYNETPKQLHCFGVPCTLGSVQFEWYEWLFCIKNSIKRWPLMQRFAW